MPNVSEYDARAIKRIRQILQQELRATTSMLFQGSFATVEALIAEKGDPKAGWSYYNSTDGKSYTYRDGTWYQMTQDGIDGQNGLSITWHGDAAAPDPSWAVLNHVYRDTDDGYVYIYNGSAWELMVQDGNDGTEGAPGTDGWNVYITYHDSDLTATPATPTGDGTTGGWHTNATAAVKWMSQKVSETASSGTWGTPIPIKGADGIDGIDAALYYIKPTTGTAIKNSTGSVSIEARYVTGNADTLLASGTVKLYDPLGNVVGDGYSATLDSAAIDNSIVISLRSGPTGTVYDTVTLVDVLDGVDGTSGNYLEYIFKRSATAPTKPNQADGIGGTAPNDWYDAPPAGTDPLWTCTAWKAFDGSFKTGVIAWDDPVQIDGTDGTNGTNGSSVTVEYSADGLTSWHSTFVAASDLYMRQSTDGGSTWTDAIRIVGETGADGDNAVVGSVDSDNGLAWVQAVGTTATPGAWTPVTTTTTLTVTFYQGGVSIATQSVTITRSVASLTATGATSDGITSVIKNNGASALTVEFTHNASSIKVAETVYAVAGATDGEDGVDGASGIVPLLSGFAFKSDDPSAGYVSWTAGKITYGTSEITMTAGGNTINKYIYWAGPTATTLSTTNTLADAVDPANDKWLVCINESGTAYPAMGERLINAGMIQVNDLAAISANLGTITAGNIDAIDINADNITAGTLTADRINSTSLSGVTAQGFYTVEEGYTTVTHDSTTWAESSSSVFLADADQFAIVMQKLQRVSSSTVGAEMYCAIGKYNGSGDKGTWANYTVVTSNTLTLSSSETEAGVWKMHKLEANLLSGSYYKVYQKSRMLSTTIDDITARAEHRYYGYKQLTVSK